MMAIWAPKSQDKSSFSMKYSNQKHAGVTNGTPWLAIVRNYPYINAKAAIKDLNSVFYFHKRLIELRKQEYINKQIY